MTFTKDTRGIAEVTAVEHANAFSTFTSSLVDTATAGKLVGTIASSQICITDVVFTAQTTTNLTLLEDTTTSKLAWNFGAGGGTKDFHFVVPLLLATGTALHYTLDATGASLYIGGYRK